MTPGWALRLTSLQAGVQLPGRFLPLAFPVGVPASAGKRKPPEETARFSGHGTKPQNSALVSTGSRHQPACPARSGGLLANGGAPAHLILSGRCCRRRRQQRPERTASGGLASCSLLTMAPTGQAGRWPFLATSCISVQAGRSAKAGLNHRIAAEPSVQVLHVRSSEFVSARWVAQPAWPRHAARPA